MSASTCLVVMYHYVRDSAATAFPAIRALPPALFEQQLDWLEHNYRLISLEDLEAALEGRTSLPPKAALLTFDDGFVDHYVGVLPILRKRGLSGVFFLAQDACSESPRVLGVHKTHFLLAQLGADAFGRAVLAECELALTAADGARRARVFGADRWEHADERAIKDLLNYELPFDEAERVLDALFVRHIGAQEAFARSLYLREPMIAGMAQAGMAFGYHTRSHRMLSRLASGDQEAELRDGIAWIRALTGQGRVPFCYPWGGPKTYTSDTLRILARTGYSVAFNTVRRRIEIGRDGRFELPRLDTRDLPPYTADEPASTPAISAEEA
jgi:peptidoglycan/xylan/chitin deacetylase (PgdA/CDA1 family)